MWLAAHGFSSSPKVVAVVAASASSPAEAGLGRKRGRRFGGGGGDPLRIAKAPAIPRKESIIATGRFIAGRLEDQLVLLLALQLRFQSGGHSDGETKLAVSSWGGREALRRADRTAVMADSRAFLSDW
jgi:hypothetical protein